MLSTCLHIAMKVKKSIQKNFRVSPEVAKWMDAHPLSNNALVTYALHLLMQIEANATLPISGSMVKIEYITGPEGDKLPF
jgi:hypothetical protein